MKVLFVILVIFSVNLFSQEKNEKPLKHESGDVVIIASDAADYYNRKNLQDLKKIQFSLTNQLGEEEYKKLLAGYISGQIAYNSRSYLESRRLFEQNHRNILVSTRKLIDFYKTRLNELAREAATVTVELDMSAGDYMDNYKNVMYNYSKSANSSQNEAEDLVQTGNLVDAVYYYKTAVLNFIKVIYYANKSKYQGMSPSVKAEKNIFIDDDYIPSKFYKDYDDSMNELFTKNELKRKRDREYAMKILSPKAPVQASKDNPKNEKDSPTKPEKKNENAEPVKPKK